MSVAVTTLSDIVTLALKTYGIRFQVSQQQLVDFVNMIQMIAYNQDLTSFQEWGQVFVLGQDVYLETDTGTYTSPVAGDIGKMVVGSSTGNIGLLSNFQTKDRIHKWIVIPPDGSSAITIVDGETLSITAGTGAGLVVTGQDYVVSNGPYKFPTVAMGNPPFRKLVGVTSVTDKQFFEVQPNNRYDGPDDYGIVIDEQPGRGAYIPYRADLRNKELTLITSSAPEIKQTTQLYGSGGATLTTSSLRWVYYTNPPTITSISDETSFILPEEYRYEVMYKGIAALADTATYGGAESIRAIIEPLCQRFWEDMSIQYQEFGRGSDYISHGDAW